MTKEVAKLVKEAKLELKGIYEGKSAIIIPNMGMLLL